MVCPITQGDHKKEEKLQDENIMVCPITQDDHKKKETTGQNYNGPRITQGGHKKPRCSEETDQS